MKQSAEQRIQAEQKIEAVRTMQECIRMHSDNSDFAPEDVVSSVRYSPRHAERMFRELTGKSIGEYLRLVRLSSSAERLLDTRDAVVEIALDAGFDSHEGFSRAFFRSFRIAPRTYRKDPPPIPLFIQYLVGAEQLLLRKKEECIMDQKSTIITVTPIARPKRKLIVLRSKHAEDYLSFCNEMGCDWAGLFNSIPEKIDTCALVELPARLTKPNTSPICAGVEVPLAYDSSKVPQGYEVLELEAGELLYFQTEPYEDEEAFCEAIDAAFEAAERYDPQKIGYAFDPDAPKYNYGAEGATGARIALPIRKLRG